MYYELRMYTPFKGKLAEYAEVYHTYPEKAYEQFGANVVGMWETDDGDQPAFVHLICFRDRAHRDAFMAAIRDMPIMATYRPMRPQLIDPGVPTKNWFLKPVRHSKLQ